MPLLAGLDLSTTGQVTVYTGVTQERTINVRACNRSASPANLTLWAVPNAQAVGNAYLIEPTISVPPGGVVEEMGIPFEVGAKIYAQAGTASAFNVMIWGL